MCRLWTATIVAAMLAWVSAAEAISLQLSDERLVEEAETIVFGNVVSANSHWNAEGTSIVTDIEIAVDQWLKGSGNRRSIQLTVRGGRVGDLVQEESETPMLIPGERAVFFLQSGKLPFVGGRQGKMSVIDGMVIGKGLSEESYAARLRSFVERSSEGIGLRSIEQNVPMLEPMTLRAPEGVVSIPVKNNERAAESYQTVKGLETLLSEGFESGFPTGSWAVGYSNSSSKEGYGYTWDEVRYNARSGHYSAWCAGGTYKGQPDLDPSKNKTYYPNNLDAWMIWGPFDLSSAMTAQMTFWYWLQSEANHDYFFWGSSTDGTNFSGFRTSGDSQGYVQQTLDLSSRLGSGQVWIAFVFQSDEATKFKGAFVDDIVITRQIQDENTPRIDTISPSHASAGTNTQVTISGANFGSSQGSGKVEFFFRPSSSKIPAQIISWSNTQITCTVPVGTVDGYWGSAASGPVTVTTSTGLVSNGYPFTVTFGYGQRRWQDNEVFYYINENNPYIVGEGAAIKAAAKTWTLDGDANFIFTYAGSSASVSRSYNGKNELLWEPLGTSGVIAQATTWYRTSDNIILECDVSFNFQLPWGFGSGDFFDVQTITTHEMGHWLSLRDLYGNLGDGVNDVAKMMYGYGSTNTVKQSLHTDDRSGVIYIYGPAPEIDDNWNTAEMPSNQNAQLRAANGRTRAKAKVRDERCPFLTSQKAPNRWWSIEAADPSYIRLYFTDDLLAAAGFSGSPVIAHYVEDHWVEVITSAPKVDEFGKYVESVYPLDSWSPFTLFDSEPISVTMTSFDARRIVEGVVLTWSTELEQNLAGYELQRSSDGRVWSHAASFVDRSELLAGASSGQYLYIDRDPEALTASFYRIRGRELDGSTTPWREAVVSTALNAAAEGHSPLTFALHPAFPNPFNAATTIRFDLPHDSAVTLAVFDVNGRLVETLLQETVPAGSRRLTWDASRHPAGLYFVRIQTDANIAVQRTMLIK